MYSHSNWDCRKLRAITQQLPVEERTIRKRVEDSSSELLGWGNGKRIQVRNSNLGLSRLEFNRDKKTIVCVSHDLGMGEEFLWEASIYWMGGSGPSGDFRGNWSHLNDVREGFQLGKIWVLTTSRSRPLGNFVSLRLTPYHQRAGINWKHCHQGFTWSRQSVHVMLRRINCRYVAHNNN